MRAIHDLHVWRAGCCGCARSVPGDPRSRPICTRRSWSARLATAASRAARRYYVDVLSVWRWNPSGARMVRDAIQDLTHGLRVFRRNPGAVATTIAGLALAIGVSTAVFSLLNATLWFRPGVADPDSAVRVERAWKGGVSHGWPYAEFLALREMSRDARIEATTIIGESLMFSTTAPTVDRDDSRRVRAGVVSGGYMTTFGARPLHGRVLLPGDDVTGAQPVAVAGYTFWTRRLGFRSVRRRPRGVGERQAGDRSWASTERRFTGITDEPPALWMSFAGTHALGYGDVPLVAAPAERRSPSWRGWPRGRRSRKPKDRSARWRRRSAVKVSIRTATTGVKLVPASRASGTEGQGADRRADRDRDRTRGAARLRQCREPAAGERVRAAARDRRAAGARRVEGPHRAPAGDGVDRARLGGRGDGAGARDLARAGSGPPHRRPDHVRPRAGRARVRVPAGGVVRRRDWRRPGAGTLRRPRRSAHATQRRRPARGAVRPPEPLARARSSASRRRRRSSCS